MIALEALSVAEFKARTTTRKLASLSDDRVLSQWIRPIELRIQRRFSIEPTDFDFTDVGGKAGGSITLGSIPVAGETVDVGSSQYTWRLAVGATAYEVAIGANATEAAANLVAAINAAAGAGSTYGTGTAANAEAAAAGNGDDATTGDVEARAAGENGNAIVLAAFTTGATVVPFTQGTDSGLQRRRDLEEDLRTATVISIDHAAHNRLSLTGTQTVDGAGSHVWDFDLPPRVINIMSRWGSESVRAYR